MSLESVSVPAGRYVVAVSGGVDSISLLNLLSEGMGLTDVVVAHVNHGIREDAVEDEELVSDLAAKLGYKFELRRLNLGSQASEASAREARYDYLNQLCRKYSAQLITAHHQDDLLETAVLNIVRGTGPHGLVGMLINDEIIRPLLNVTKQELQAYAQDKSLVWREDSTNSDDRYLRNYIRIHIMPRLEPQKDQLLKLIDSTSRAILELDAATELFLQEAKSSNRLKRSAFLGLDFKSLTYVIRFLLVQEGVQDVNRPMIERVSMAVKTLPVGKRLDIDGGHQILSSKDFIEITTTR